MRFSSKPESLGALWATNNEHHILLALRAS